MMIFLFKKLNYLFLGKNCLKITTIIQKNKINWQVTRSDLLDRVVIEDEMKNQTTLWCYSK